MPFAFPEHGLSREDVLTELQHAKIHDVDWHDGRLGLYVHFAGDDILDVAKDAHRMFFSENALGSSAFPSLRRFEEEIVGWTASLLGCPTATGTVTSGGTESIFLAMKTARDWACARRGFKGKPVVIAAESAHPAFDKSAHYLGLQVRRVPLSKHYRADPSAMEMVIDDDCFAIVGSAPAFPHGVIDPIKDIGEIASRHGLWFHVDACVGGFLGPFVRRIGYSVPDFDFTIAAVTSISADLHKYGFTAKGASTLLLREPGLQEFQVFDFDAWPRGHYRSSTFTGTRPGGPIAAAWAVIRYLGIEGYQRIARTTMETRDRLAKGISEIDGLAVVGDPELAVLAYAVNGIDIDSLAEAMEDRGWFVTTASKPQGIHLGMLTPAHAPVADRYLADLRTARTEVLAGRPATRRRTSSYGD